MSVLDGHDIVYVARVPTSRIMTVAINVGTRFPAYATSMGRVLLAGLDDAALDAHLARLDLEAFTARTVAHRRRAARPGARGPAAGLRAGRPGARDGLRSLAAPVRDRSGRSSPRSTSPPTSAASPASGPVRELLPPLLHAVSEIETDLSRT